MPDGQHNYLTIVIDDMQPRRIRTTGKTTIVKGAEGLSNGTHTITICKATESGTGYLEFMGFICEELVPFGTRPERMIEFIGNSITSSAGSDASLVACDKGQWYDQHNAYMSYGPMTARALNAQWQLSAVSGIGLMKSWGFDKTMPQVYDKMDMRHDTHPWNFKNYKPNVVTVCLGENDGPQDSTQFAKNYIAFIGTLRKHYPEAYIVCLSSPMAEPSFNQMIQYYLKGITGYVNTQGDKEGIVLFLFKDIYRRLWWSSFAGTARAACDRAYHLFAHSHRVVIYPRTPRFRGSICLSILTLNQS